MRNNYTYVKPSDTALKLMDHFRECFSKLHDDIELSVTGNRNRSIAVTHLEDAAMRLNRAINEAYPLTLNPLDVVADPLSPIEGGGLHKEECCVEGQGIADPGKPESPAEVAGINLL